MDTILLGQGKGQLVSLGTIVFNICTVSCGLVVAYFEDASKVACFHWPGFDTENESCCNDFRRLYSQFGEYEPMTKLIAIINRPVNSDEEIIKRQAAQHLKSQFSSDVEFHYCTVEDDGRGNVGIILNMDNSYIIYNIVVDLIL